MIAINPIFGSGSGGFSESYARVVAEDSGWRAMVTDDPHQQYLLIAGEQGLVGLALFFAILMAMLISRGDKDNRLMAIGILLATVLNGMFNGHFGSFVEGKIILDHDWSVVVFDPAYALDDGCTLLFQRINEFVPAIV